MSLFVEGGDAIDHEKEHIGALEEAIEKEIATEQNALVNIA